MKYIFSLSLIILLFNSCATKKEVLYLQDLEDFNNTSINFSNPKIQANDILKITVGALIEDAVKPYNKSASLGTTIELMKLDGYD